MGEIFMFSFNAIMPILLLVALGYILKCLKFASEDFFKTANSMVFRVFLPILLFYNVYEIGSLSDVKWDIVLFCVVCVLIITAIGLVVSKVFVKRNDRVGVVTQCAFRSNHAIIGIPLAESLGGTSAVAFASIISAAAIPLFNTLAVVVLSYYGDKDKKPSVKETLIRTIKNPLIIGVACGLVVLAIRTFIPVDADGVLKFSLENNCPFIFKAIVNASKVASPLALVVLGARFDFSAVRNLFKEIAIGVVMRLVVSSLVGIGLAFVLTKYTGVINVTTNEYPALVSLFGSPVAVSSAVMVGEIGGDDQLAAQLVVWTSMLSMLSLFVTVFIMKSFCLL
ncbi:MAG: AEC family transporter [Faecalibacterium sp.]|nr:AEC family transporter [Ruminococcus flavefaciens]MCM1392033.1 AEC family transporter [Ruminococcus sp.]MCM1484840.1 AEC family transporter [Faecalibacterium sp.]